MTLKDVSIRELAQQTVQTGHFGQEVSTNELRWLNVAALAKEFEQRGYREMGFALRYHPREIEAPLVCLIAEYYFRRAVAAEANLKTCVRRYATRKRTLAARSAPQRDRSISPEGIRARGRDARVASARLGRHAVPALDLQVERHRIGKPHADLYNDIVSMAESIGLAAGAIRRRDSKRFNNQTDGQLLQELITCYMAIPKYDRDDRVALRNMIGRFRFLTGDFAGAAADFAANVQQLADPFSKGETLFNAYHCA